MPLASRQRIKNALLQEIRVREEEYSHKPIIPLAGIFNWLFHSRIGYSFSAAVLLIAVGVGTSAAANPAKPGDLLFPLDKAVERVQLALAMSPVKRVKVAVKIATERMEELAKLSEEVATEATAESEEIAPLVGEEGAFVAATSTSELDGAGNNLLSSTTEIIGTTTAASTEKVKPEKKEARDNLKKAAEETKDALNQAIDLIEKAEEGTKEIPNAKDTKGINEAKTALKEQAETSIGDIKKAKETLLGEGNGTKAAIEEVERTLEEKVNEKFTSPDQAAEEGKGDENATSTANEVSGEKSSEDKEGEKTAP